MHGLSTRAVDDLVRARGLEGVSKSQVGRPCAAIDERVRDVLTRRIEGDWPCPWLDATPVQVREVRGLQSLGRRGLRDCQPW